MLLNLKFWNFKLIILSKLLLMTLVQMPAKLKISFSFFNVINSD